ncbi:MAG: MATE family efflux transporter [Defluviitaleaceae bacterium]|nr:MATE family efflux transporter [Defluviitaleaceae bacterium]
MDSLVRKFKQVFGSVDMTEGAPWKKLLLFTVPLLIGNIFQQLYSTADAIILGQHVGDNALAAVGSTMAIFFLIMVLMMGIAIGAGVMVAQYFGARNRDALSYTIGSSITLTFILGLVIMIFGPLGTRPLLVLLSTPPEILEDSIVYINILLWGVLTMSYFNILSGILRGLGDAFSPLIYLAIASLLNIVLSLVFVAGLGWGVAGAAIGTVIAQGFSSVLCLIKLLKMTKVFEMNLHYLRLKKDYALQILKLGIPTGASQAIIAIAVMIVQPLVNSFGALFIATHVVIMRIDGFVMMPNFSFGNAMTVFAGQNMGAGKIERISKATKQCVILAAGTATVLIAIILLFGRYIAGFFTETQEVISLSQEMLLILAPGYIVFSIAMVMWGTVRGSGDAMSPLWASIINTVFVRVPTAYLFVHLMGTPHALMYSLLAGWVGNTILSLIVYRIGKWRSKGLVQPNKPETTAEET